ncbi:MAG TPA: MipA/OmpV family protein [Chromatiales bacterium]|nr:MipA/OmpV family protein [Thiotrichales bacterium]HIP69489.1 MipA/OmpV family protein [Chromatiales bacterium]
MNKKLFTLSIALCFLSLQTSHAQEKPLWEAGFGAGALSLPDYRGSDEHNLLLIPVPYIIYRGDRFKIDRGGMRSRLFGSDRAKLEISLNASIPVDSDDNSVRRAMPDLDPTFEIGPRLDLLLTEVGDQGELHLKLPLRALVTTGLDYEGWLFHPNLDLYLRNFYEQWNLGIKFGPIFADEKYHNYYYGVEPQFATTSRPAFDADAGYSGTALITSLSKRFDKFWIGAFARYDNLQGVSFEDSPLMENEHSLMGGVAFAWIFAKSKRMVAVE